MLVRLVAGLWVCVSAWTQQYEVDNTFPADNTSWVTESARPTAVGLGGGLVHVVQRGHGVKYPVTSFDHNGIVRSRWGSPEIQYAHGLKAHAGAVWITDMGDFTVKQFDAESHTLIRTLGTPGVAGQGIYPLQFGNVSDVALLGAMHMWIADGDCLCMSGGMNHRVLKLTLSPTGYHVDWVVGNDGTFQNPHAIDLDEKRLLLFVADREHNRTVALDAMTGKLRGAWSVSDVGPASHRPSVNGLRIDHRNDQLVLGMLPAPIHSTGGIFQVAAFSLSSVLTARSELPRPCLQLMSPVRGLHELAIDQQTGDLYLAYFEAGQFGRMLYRPSVYPGSGLTGPSSQTDCTNEDLTILSYHIHVLFHGADAMSMKAAMERRADFMETFSIKQCEMAHSDPAPEYIGVCAFPLEFDPKSFPISPGGPFTAPNLSFFVSLSKLALALGWWQAHRFYRGEDSTQELDVFLHTNTGCQERDHTDLAVWAGTKWEMNLDGLACCRNGPSACRCLDVYYIQGGKCLGVKPRDALNGEYVVAMYACNQSEFSPMNMWHEVTYSEGRTEIDSLGQSFGHLAATDTCLSATKCELGARVITSTCGLGDKMHSRFRYQRGSTGKLVSASCPRLCVIATDSGEIQLGRCDSRSAHIDRLCVMAPGNRPQSCPPQY